MTDYIEKIGPDPEGDFLEIFEPKTPGDFPLPKHSIAIDWHPIEVWWYSGSEYLPDLKEAIYEALRSGARKIQSEE